MFNKFILLALCFYSSGILANNSEIARGIEYTEVTHDVYKLNKSAKSIVSTNELRLALYFAVRDGKVFQLNLDSDAIVEEELKAQIHKYGGEISYEDLSQYSLFIGHILPDGSEGDGWVLGNQFKWLQFQKSQSEVKLSEYLQVGNQIGKYECGQLSQKGNVAEVSEKNIDGEILSDAMQNILTACATQGGFVFIQ
ncbi:TPA: hypothetical protein I7181_21825 [Vibrio vulnificus]|nr:hypothetical protein [Vibrio vulnificus]HAS6240044.1 hypothetical protein [Vibrio vulnificus]HAT8516307.1 hypothetical protein [Vibrio vulnificus]